MPLRAETPKMDQEMMVNFMSLRRVASPTVAIPKYGGNEPGTTCTGSLPSSPGAFFPHSDDSWSSVRCFYVALFTFSTVHKCRLA